MLKRWALKYWPLVLLLVLIVAILGMSHYAERRKAENQEYAQAGSPEAAVAPLDADKGTKKTNKPKYPPSWIDTFAWPEGVTGWALFLTLFVIAWQSVETHAAAEAARDSVQAQEKSMKLTVNSERPYLVISVESQLPNQFIFTANNEGQTPARINSIWSKLLMEDPDGTLQIPSDEEMAESVMSTPPQLLPPKGTCTVYFCDEHRMELMRGETFRAVYFHGRISYSNTLGVDLVRPYETKWLYSQLPLKGKLAIPRPDARRPEHNTWT